MMAAAAASSLALRLRQSDSRAARRDSASWLDRRSSCNTTGTLTDYVRVAVIVVITATTLFAQSDPKSQSDRAAARIRTLQAESDKLAAQARTVFGELRRLEIDREIKQVELSKAQTALARVTADRDRVEKRLKDLEAIRIAQTPGVKERLIELSKHGRAGYVQLLLASNDVRAIGRMARGVAAVAEMDRVRLETHRRTLAAERDALNELDQKYDEVE